MNETWILAFIVFLCLLEKYFLDGFWQHSQWQTDLIHFLITPRIVLILHTYILAPLAALILGFLAIPPIPGKLEPSDLIGLFLIADFLGYLIHFLQHRIPVLWRFHRVHHSPKILNTLASSRFHPLDTALQQAAWYMPFFLWAYRDQRLEADEAGWILMMAAFLILHIIFTHFRLPCLGAFEQILVTPSFHHRHHKIGVHGNFGLQLTIWDRIFKTWLPKSVLSLDYGITPPLEDDFLIHLWPPQEPKAQRGESPSRNLESKEEECRFDSDSCSS